MEPWLEQLLPIDPELRSRILWSVATVFFLWAARVLLLAAIRRRVDDLALMYRVRKTSTYVAVFLGVFLVGRLWFEGLRQLSTFLGLLSAGIAIALKDPITNVAGWGFLLWRRPFQVGDRIAIGDRRGDVIDIRLFQFSLMEIGEWVNADQPTGRVVHVPNALVFTTPQVNYTREFRYLWHEMPVLVTFESDWQKAKDLLRAIVEKHGSAARDAVRPEIERARERLLLYNVSIEPTVITSVADSGVLLTMRYVVEARRRREVAQAVWEDVLHAFAGADDIDFAYPTTRFYMNATEGKAGARAEVPHS